MPGFIAGLDLYSDPMEPPALLSADHVCSALRQLSPFDPLRVMAWNRDRDWSHSSWKTSSSWDKNTSSGWNNRDWQREQPSVPSPSVSIPSTFVSDWECYSTNPVSNKKFFSQHSVYAMVHRSTKSGLAGKDVANLRVTDLTRKGLDDYSLRCVSNGEFQTIVFCEVHF